MTDRKRELSFGRYLMSERLSRGIRLKAVSDATRIGTDTLLAIENEDHGALPAEVFVKGFLRAYARFVGADPDKAVALYLARQEAEHSSREAETDLSRAHSGFWRRFATALAVLALVIASVLYADHALRRTPPSGTDRPASEGAPETGAPKGAVSPGKPAPEEAPAATGDTGEDAASSGSFVAASPPAGPPPAAEAEGASPASTESTAGGDAGAQRAGNPPAGADGAPSAEAARSADAAPLVLEVSAVEDTWLKVIVDIDEPSEYTMHPGDRLILRAAEGFNLLVGNATGVRLALNGKPVPVSGKKGQVVNLQIP